MGCFSIFMPLKTLQYFILLQPAYFMLLKLPFCIKILCSPCFIRLSEIQPAFLDLISSQLALIRIQTHCMPGRKKRPFFECRNARNNLYRNDVMEIHHENIKANYKITAYPRIGYAVLLFSFLFHGLILYAGQGRPCYAVSSWFDRNNAHSVTLHASCRNAA